MLDGPARAELEQQREATEPLKRAGFERACENQDDAQRRACRLAAAEVFAAAGATKPTAELFRPLCDDDPAACVRWGRTLAEDPRTYRKAVALFRQACTAGDPAGCARLARMMALGRGV